MTTASVTVTDHELDHARRLARAAAKRLPVKDERALAPLETLLGVYEVVRQRTDNHDASLLVAAREARRTVLEKSGHVHIDYPDTPGAIARGIECTASVIAGYCDGIAVLAKRRLAGQLPSTISVGTRTYRFNKTPETAPAPVIVGLDEERAALRKYTRQLFCYDPATGDNADRGSFPRSILLTGPPGTGKSSLLRELFEQARSLERLTRVPCSIELYDASRFSSYFGRSARLLKQAYGRASDPRGVGFFCVEDADMVLQSRDDTHVSHGILELQQYLLNVLSGVTADRGNVLTFLTTNRPEAFDAALRSRIQREFTVDPFVHAQTHESYMRVFASHLPLDAIDHLARTSYERRLRGRDLESVFTLARERATSEPTDAELAERTRSCEHGLPTADALQTLIKARAPSPPPSPLPRGQ